VGLGRALATWGLRWVTQVYTSVRPDGNALAEAQRLVPEVGAKHLSCGSRTLEDHALDAGCTAG
jgi:hypothetical protein